MGFSTQRLKNWEIRERKKARDYSKDAEREGERRRDMVNETRHDPAGYILYT